MNGVERVVLIVIDGLRPDALLQGHSPRLDALIASGACSLQAQTVMPSITLPTHLSMFYSIPTEKHTVQSNTYQPFPEAFTGLFELAHQNGLRTAAVYSWEPLRDLWRPGNLLFGKFINIYGGNGRDYDAEVARAAIELIPAEKPEVTFVYLGMVDEIGHHYSWLSPEYMAGVERADAAVGQLVDCLQSEGLLDGAAILIQADHGGHEHRHGEEIPDDMTIPWILTGAGVCSGCRLEQPVSILDTAPTLAHLLGLPLPAEWQGRIVREALQ